MIEELLKRGRFDVVQEATGVDALVEGELTSYAVVPGGLQRRGGRTRPRPAATRSR